MGRRAGPVRPKWHHGQWWAHFSHNGKRERIPLGIRDEGATADAEAAASEAQAKHILQHPIERPAPRRRSAGDLVDLMVQHIAWLRAQNKSAEYIRKKECHFKGFLERWSDLLDITEPEIGRWQAERGKEVGSVTLYKEEVTLSRFLAWARDVGHLVQSVPRIQHCRPVSEYEPIRLSRPQVDRLLAALPDRRSHKKRCPVREFYTVQWALALRVGETQHMRWNWIDFNEAPKCPLGVINLPALWQKNRKPWREGLPRPAYDVLTTLKREREDRARAQGVELLPNAPVFGRVGYETSLRQAAVKLGLGNVVSHHLRHARITEVAHNSRDIAAVQHVARHETLAMTQEYIETMVEYAADAMFAADAAAEATPPKRPTRPRKR